MRAVEERSAAEVVILVRERSGPYLHASVLAGAIAAYLTLWFQLFSPFDYSLLLIQIALTGAEQFPNLMVERNRVS